MGTRGAIGFWKDGEYKVAYNHLDSYPEELGNTTLKFINKRTINELNTAFEKIKLIKEESIPTEEQIKQCEKYTDLYVGNQSTSDWYCLLRQAQGNLEAYTNIGLMVDSQDFLTDGLFCEWAYIINLTNNTFEVYKGFQKSTTKGRYSEPPPNDQGYYTVGLVATYSLGNCPIKFSIEQTPELF